VALNLAGVYYYSTDRSEKAGEYLRLNAEINPESASAVAGYVEYLMYAGLWRELSEEGRAAYSKFPYELTFLEMASIGDYNLKEYDKVLEICDHVIEKAPSDSSKTLRAWSTKGDVYHLIGQPSKSYKAYENALKVNPDYVYVLNNYAYYLSMEGKKLKKAYQMSCRTIEAEPDNATYLDTFGWILYLLGKPEEAKTHFKRAMLYGGKESPVILDHYAEVLFALGEYDLAMVYWNKALQINNGEVKDLQERINRRKQQRRNGK
jgi:tetratricopeptide (TPR) repeat protein